MECKSSCTTTLKMPIIAKFGNGASLDLNQLLGVVEAKKYHAKFFAEQEAAVSLTGTDFIEDEGNSSPKYLKSSFPVLPEEAQTINNSGIPLVLEVNPVADLHESKIIPRLDATEECPICQAVLCDATITWENDALNCIFCSYKVEISPETKFDSGTIDLVQAEMNSMPLGIVFVIETSQETAQNGLLQYMKTYFKDFLVSLEILFPDLQIALLTYSNNLYFWSINEMYRPCTSVICIDQKPFLPHPNMFFSLKLFINNIDQIMDLIIKNPETMDDHIPSDYITFVIEAASEVIHNRGSCGRIILWHSSAEKCEMPVSQQQENINIQQKYIALAKHLVDQKSSIDIFLCNRSGFMDVANKGYLCHKTGGQLYFYINFNGNFDCTRIFADTLRRLKMNTVVDCMLKVQVTSGLDIKAFYGDISYTSKNECLMCSMDERKSIFIEAKLSARRRQPSVVQMKFYFTSTNGARFIRILNYKFERGNHDAHVFHCCNTEIVANFWSKKAIYQRSHSNFCGEDVKQLLKKTAAQIFSYYIKNLRRHLWPPSFNFILPYIRGILNATALFGALGVKDDQRNFEMYAINSMNTVHFCKYIYPLLIPCSNVSQDKSILRMSMDCCDNYIKSSDAYILDNGLYQFLYVGKDVPSSFLSDVFQVATISEVDRSIITFPGKNTSWCKKLRGLMQYLNDDGFFTKKLFIIVEGDKREAVFHQYIPVSNGIFYRNSYESFLEELASFMS